MHPAFWNSLNLIDINFGTKGPIDLKQKALQSWGFALFFYMKI